MTKGDLNDLKDAVAGTSAALRTRTLVTRHSIQKQSVVYCQTPMNSDVVKALKQRLAIIRAELRALQKGFPVVKNFAYTGTYVEDHDKWNRLLFPADRVDESRNFLLAYVNAHLPQAKQFPLMPLSSVVQAESTIDSANRYRDPYTGEAISW